MSVLSVWSTTTNPRLLKCGHQFCEVCLTNILKQSPKGEIICPTCRDVTKPKLGDVTTLPRSTLHQYIQELIFQLPQKEVLGKTCTKCQAKEPTRHCPDCKEDLSYMCDDCFAKHQLVPRFAKHETVPFDPLLVCTEHPHKWWNAFVINVLRWSAMSVYSKCMAIMANV